MNKSVILSKLADKIDDVKLHLDLDMSVDMFKAYLDGLYVSMEQFITNND